MSLEIQKLTDIVDKEEIIVDPEILHSCYCKPILEGKAIVPKAAVLPKNTEQIIELLQYFRTIKNINIVVISSTTSPKFLNDTNSRENTVIIDLHEMKEVIFIDKRNRVCVVEPGVTWKDLIPKLKTHGLRPLSPFLPRPGKSALASVLDREPHLVPKKQYDISDPLLCMEVVFGNGEMFRTGEAAGPQSLEENRKFGAALTNPIGPGQTDIFRIIQGAKGSYGIVSWISMQCDEIPVKRIVSFVESDDVNPLTEFLYAVVRKRWIDEAFILNDTLFKSIFPLTNSSIKKYVLVFAINGYENFFPDEKISYQFESCNEVLKNLNIEAVDNIAGITQKDIEPLLDGNTIDPHPKFSEKTISIDVFYNSTLDRIQEHISSVDDILKKQGFPLERVNIYLQPVIQARSVNIEFSLLADRPDSGNQEFSIEKVKKICKIIAQNVASKGAFFSRSYNLINDIAFSRDDAFIEGLIKLKRIFDPDNILNKGQLIF